MNREQLNTLKKVVAQLATMEDNGYAPFPHDPDVVPAAQAILLRAELLLKQRERRPGLALQMQDVLLACGELNKRERVAVQWTLDHANDIIDGPVVPLGDEQRARIIAILDGFLHKGQSLGASHPHFASFFAFSEQQWEAAKELLKELQ